MTEQIILKTYENNLYGLPLIEFLKALKPHMNKQLDSVEQIMFQLFSMNIQKGFTINEVEVMKMWFKDHFNIEIKTEHDNE